MVWFEAKVFADSVGSGVMSLAFPAVGPIPEGWNVSGFSSISALASLASLISHIFMVLWGTTEAGLVVVVLLTLPTVPV
jgi:hypothetical protein